MTHAYVGLGANLGEAQASLELAAIELAQIPGVATLKLSRFYRSAPVDATGPDYINAVAAIDTSLSARELLNALQRIENQHGRLRPYRNAPRTLDLDLLLYGDETIDEPDLVVPHPRMHQRAFVLVPLAELDPTLRLSQGGLPALIAACAGQELEALPPKAI